MDNACHNARQAFTPRPGFAIVSFFSFFPEAWLILFFFFLACASSCLNCSGSSYSQCTSCNVSTTIPYLVNGLCSPSCESFQYAPAGTYTCISCDCNGWSNECIPSTGECLCTNNTAGDNCQLCATDFYRPSANLTQPCIRKSSFGRVLF